MDPLADKLLVCSALICFVDLHRMPTWVVLIIIAREFIISGFRLVAAEGGLVIAAGIWGKYKTAITMITIIFMIPNFGGSVVFVIEQILIYLSLILTIVSLIDYLVHNQSVLAGKM
jgi:CDP-diacylglycerol--glycerol-3-phosphate 3-phosphatidyltransferase